MTADDLLRHYEGRKGEIRARLAEFPKVYRKGDLAIFKELCFCILTANTSAKMGITCIEAAGDEFLTADLEGLRNILRGRYRFWKTRPAYIIHTREYIKRETGIGNNPPNPPLPKGGWGGFSKKSPTPLRDKIDSLTGFHGRRDFFANNPGVKGLGYKEASHFLRNIGFKGYAILDKHIVNMLFELGVLPTNDRPANRKKYIEIEERLREFSDKVGIDMDEMDLALWSYKTGMVLK